MEKQGKTFDSLFDAARISEKGLDDAAETIKRTSDEALKNAISQGAYERLLTGSRIALDDLNAVILDTPKSVNFLTEQIARLATGLEALGLSIAGILTAIGGTAYVKSALVKARQQSPEEP